MICLCNLLSRVWLFAALWTVARQAPLSMGFPRQDNKWVAISSSRESSWPKDWTCVSCTGRQILYRLNHQGSPMWSMVYRKAKRNRKIMMVEIQKYAVYP